MILIEVILIEVILIEVILIEVEVNRKNYQQINIHMMIIVINIQNSPEDQFIIIKIQQISKTKLGNLIENFKYFRNYHNNKII